MGSGTGAEGMCAKVTLPSAWQKWMLQAWQGHFDHCSTGSWHG